MVDPPRDASVAPLLEFGYRVPSEFLMFNMLFFVLGFPFLAH